MVAQDRPVDSQDLRHVGHGVAWETRHPGSQADISRSVGPTEVAGERHDHDGGQGTGVERVTLDLARSPLTGFKDTTPCRADERIDRSVDLRDGSDFVRRVSRHILAECRAVQLASRSTGTARKALGSLEDIIGH
jgi:hypothetical protein